MTTILVQKSGLAFWPREKIWERSQYERPASQATASEQGITEAMIRHLIGRGDLRVVYFGQYKSRLYTSGQRAWIDGLEVIAPHVFDYDEYTTIKQQNEGFRRDLEQIAPLEPKLIIANAGYASQMSMIDNPKGVSVQTCATRYTAPMLAIQHALKLPRVVVCNDVRSYPKEQEMNWLRVAPCALLGQRAQELTTVVGGTRWRRCEVRSHAENWVNPPGLKARKSVQCAMIAHAHIASGNRQKARDAIFHAMLDGPLPPEFQVYGSGWEHYSGYDVSIMRGPLRPDDAAKMFAATICSPMLAPATDFYTNKPKFCVAQRCVPLFWGRGGPFTLDPLGKYMPLDGKWRLEKPGDLRRVADQLEQRSNKVLLADLWDRMHPDFSLLDSCINDILAGRDTSTESWWQKYGGYRHAV